MDLNWLQRHCETAFRQIIMVTLDSRLVCSKHPMWSWVSNDSKLDYMNINKSIKIFFETIGQIWNNLIEMFLEWPFSELFLKFWFVNKHDISELRLLAPYRHKEILVNSSLKATKKNWLEQSQKIRWAIQGHLGPLVLERAELSDRVENIVEKRRKC